MTLRLPSALALCGLLALSACDFGGDSDDITGVWSTTIDYQVDSLLADQNYRIVADYSATYTFELLNEDGLIYGRITSSLDGSMSGQEAGREPVVYTLDPEESVTDYVFGTYRDPELELDVPWGPYQENLWTFEKKGGRAELAGQVVHEWQFETLYTSAPGTFSFIVDGDKAEVTSIRRDSREAPALADPASVAPQREDPLLILEALESEATLQGMRVRSE